MSARDYNVNDVYSGEIGRLREEFCAGFLKRKHHTFRRIQTEVLSRIEANKEEVSCREGCPACCVLYVEANIQECETIAYYLYRHPDVLSLFLRQYDAWRDRMRQLGGSFSLCERVLHERKHDEVSQTDQSSLLDALLLYQEQDIPCSFLHEGSCMIHDVRPYSCCNHYVTTPDEWCRTGNWCDPTFPHKPHVYLTEVDEIYDRSFYCQELTKPVIGFMQSMVFNIITRGLDYVADMTGIEALRKR